MKVVVNRCYGGFGLSDAAYEKLGEWGIPIRKHVAQVRGPDGRFDSPPENEGEVIFDRELTLRGEDESHDRLYWAHRHDDGTHFLGRYWELWLRDNRHHPLLVRLVEEMGDAADGKFAELEVVEVPDGVQYTIEEYDGREWVAEVHRTW